MSKQQNGVVYSTKLGFRQLDPIPSREALESFYGEEYFSANPGRAPDIKRLMDDSEEADPERQWLLETIYADVAHYIRSAETRPQRLLDVGCGTGDFVLFASTWSGWSACGVEMSPAGVEVAEARDARVARGTIHDAERCFGRDFDALTMFNLLEHVPDPLDTVKAARDLLKPGGRLVVQVPNDFSSFQEAVREHLDVSPWWIAVPDHINYFDFETLEAVLSRYGFETLVRYGTYPMEFFLLAGIDYLGDREAGSNAHRRRCAFEMSLSSSQRREVYERFGRAGLGRNAVIVARRT